MFRFCRQSDGRAMGQCLGRSGAPFQTDGLSLRLAFITTLDMQPHVKPFPSSKGGGCRSSGCSGC
ncbi:hypothetical protein CHLRE_06g268925v5 [Chlamydomonas reinhardtii]|uniref:Uncharacterized protein n=1 Tax=Chlamydomonas reinhardtii TaxID=3055 RepID=A0A2K3DN89_CHLRE|nr:uncharacterized protein CHLRE_06g268925v5 [Chlamydomonas reinhardtii]PNW81982.1 hypothetical protein CHLRE_06g268925v5 [Chlamydomonas reinhardtii]